MDPALAADTGSEPSPLYFPQVLDDKRKWWKVRDSRGQEGYVPYNILRTHSGPPEDRSQSPARNLVSQGELWVSRDNMLGARS